MLLNVLMFLRKKCSNVKRMLFLITKMLFNPASILHVRLC